VSLVGEKGRAQSLTRTRTEARERVEMATGLSFDQLCRTVLLAQNRFAAFLDAKDSDRAALLDRITNTGIYKLLSQKAHERRNGATHGADAGGTPARDRPVVSRRAEPARG
jgi:DNA repair protein SbcC/Rad50